MTTSETDTQNRFAEAFGYPKGRAATKVIGHMTTYVQEFIGRSPFVVMASGDDLDERRLLLPDVAGNKLFQSYQNMDSNPHVGLVFFIPGVNDTVRVNGRITFTDKEDLAGRNVELSLYEPDDNAKQLQGIIIEVEEAYGHCPRALKFSHLWDVEEISANQAQRPISER